MPPVIWILCLLTQYVFAQRPENLVEISNITMFPQTYPHNIYAGYLNISANEKSLYYIFAESQSSPANDPVILWLNGGPGCSSLMGFVTEHGPFLFKPGSTEMYINDHSWNKKANVLYLEAPAGVGFTYAKESAKDTNDTQTAIDNLMALRVFFEQYSKYQGNDFYLAGESYAGIYIPMLAEEIVDYNSGHEDNRINLRGMLLGNPCTHPKQCYTPTELSRFFSEFLFNHGFLDESLYLQYQSECLINERSAACIKLQGEVYDYFISTGANIYNVYGKCFHPRYPQQFSDILSEEIMDKFEAGLNTNLKHPLRCSDAIGSLILFNSNEFREALHVDQLNDTLPWTPCRNKAEGLNYTVEPRATFSILPSLVKEGLRILYFSGDQDAIVPLEGTKWWFQQYRNQYGAAVKKSWRPWVTSSQNISGMVWELEGLTLATVRGAGHMVPSDKPIEAEQILNVFLGYSGFKQPDNYFESQQ